VKKIRATTDSHLADFDGMNNVRDPLPSVHTIPAVVVVVFAVLVNKGRECEVGVVSWVTGSKLGT